MESYLNAGFYFRHVNIRWDVYMRMYAYTYMCVGSCITQLSVYNKIWNKLEPKKAKKEEEEETS